MRLKCPDNVLQQRHCLSVVGEAAGLSPELQSSVSMNLSAAIMMSYVSNQVIKVSIFQVCHVHHLASLLSLLRNQMPASGAVLH